MGAKAIICEARFLPAEIEGSRRKMVSLLSDFCDLCDCVRIGGLGDSNVSYCGVVDASKNDGDCGGGPAPAEAASAAVYRA